MIRLIRSRPDFAFLMIIMTLAGCNQIDSSLIEDFESSSYGQWTVEGDAFGEGPRKEGRKGAIGSRSASSKNGSGIGSLSSAPILINHDAIHFLMRSIEGDDGQTPDVEVQFIVDDQVVRKTIPSRFHAMFWESWDVSEYKGKQGRIRLVDKDDREWAYMVIDHIVQNDIPSERPWIERSITLAKPMMNFPVKTRSARQYIELFVDGKQVRAMDVELSTDEPDFWVASDLSPWLGKEILIRSRQHPLTGSDILDGIRLADGILESEDLYRESLRPQFHFSARRGWLNDPNGLVYYDGEYHLYYQANPFGRDHSRNDYNKVWGHAVSTDLVHWKELPAAIHPDHLGSIYSGSSVVDAQNTSGFQTGEESPIVAIYTSAGNRSPRSEGKQFSQSIAYSNDRGRTFTPYEGNPVLPNVGYINRDPKVIWHEASGKWVMVLHMHLKSMAFYTSSDLKSWQYQSEFPVEYEDCPELFQLAVNGDKRNKKWIHYGGRGDYYIGEFDGRQFTPETSLLQFSYGNCFYASQTFNNIPEEDGRRIQVAWGHGIKMPGMPFNQQMLFPVDLSLHSTDEGLRMFANPVREIENIHGKNYSWTDTVLRPGQNFIREIKAELLDIEVEFEPGSAEEFGFHIHGRPVIYNIGKSELSCKDSSAKLKPENGKIRMRILADRATIEVFANNGRVYMPMHAKPEGDNQGIEIFSKGGETRVRSLVIHELNSIWQ